jgi:hypothetical protein
MLLLLAHEADVLARTGPQVRLPKEIEVPHQILSLADLLPEDAPEPLRRRLSQITLGSAPLPGNHRVLSRDDIRNYLQQAPELLQTLLIPTQVAISRSYRVVTAEEIHQAVIGALRERGVQSGEWPSPQEIQISAPVLATRDESGLIVQQIEPDKARNLTRFRMFLAKEERSVPFYATVHRVVNLPRVLPNGVLQATAADGNAAGGMKKPGLRRTPAIVRPGTPATLLLETGSLRLTTSVMPLQSGAQGQRILVRNLETKHTLRAEVIAPNFVRRMLANRELK